MSAGHSLPGHGENTFLSQQVINRLGANIEIRKRIYAFYNLDRSHDLPYLGGYSSDGKTIYIDRHFPDQISYELDGYKKTFDATNFIRLHEVVEKALIDCLGWDYWQSHHAANGFERRAALKAGVFWTPYNKALSPFEKADEHEKLKVLPKDLDLTPYYAPPINHKLLDHMLALLDKGKRSKTSVNYTDRGPVGTQCKECEHFIKPCACEGVAGKIAPAGWCKRWEEQDVETGQPQAWAAGIYSG